MTRIANHAETFPVVTMNLKDGSVQGHAAGCADLKRGTQKYSEPYQANDVLEVETKHDAWVCYNEDFLAEGPESGQYEITWLPCAKHVPQGADDTYEAWLAEQDEAHGTIAEDVLAAIAPATAGTTIKRGTKWTYVYVDGALVAEIRNDQAHLLAAL